MDPDWRCSSYWNYVSLLEGISFFPHEEGKNKNPTSVDLHASTSMFCGFRNVDIWKDVPEVERIPKNHQNTKTKPSEWWIIQVTEV